MKKHILLASFLFLFLFQNCSSNDCNKLCFTPPNPFQFEFFDATTKENLFTNNTFNKSDITITNLVNNSNVTFSFIDENNYNILAINSIGWETEIVTCSIEIDGKQVAILYVNAKRVSEDCCSFTRYQEIRIENASYTLDNQSGLYTVFID